MKSFKMNNLQRLLSFILIAVLLICTVGFAANGWQSEPDNEPDSGNVDNNNDNTDENTDGNNDQQTPPTPDNDDNLPPNNDSGQNSNPNLPPQINGDTDQIRFTSSITGLEISEETYNSVPLGFVVNPDMPLYGISNSDLTVEFPIEDGSTRLLSYTTNFSMLWKIGTLMPTRAFISSTSNFFGGIVISYGNDDVVKYSAWDSSKIDLDISKISDCYYIENTIYIYTSKDMVDTAVAQNNSLTKSTYKAAPYDFSDTNIAGNVKASTLTLPYSENGKSEFYYSETSSQYLYYKSGKRKVDMLNGKNISFTNIFVLFANATTYEKADGTELVMDTTAGGTGYYISNGSLTEIKWSIDENGSLVFKSLNGQRLIVNKGNAYIGYFKASQASMVSVS